MGKTWTACDELELASKQRQYIQDKTRKIAMEQGQWVFHMIPKIHMLDHMVRRSYRTGLAVWLTWTFCDEDFMGFLARVAASTHASSTNKVPVQRWLLAFYNSTA